MARTPRAADAAPEPERIAVVFVHGQGEQTPMTDVEELVESVWRTDPRAEDPNTPGLAPVYSVPLYDRESSAQRRVVTREINGKQIDFYQFYWADLMEGNRFEHLWKWFADLMHRRPDEVPAPIWPIRMTTMALALFVGLWGPLFALIVAAGLGHDRLNQDGGGIGMAAMIALVAALVAGVLASRPAPDLPRAPDKAETRKGARGRIIRRWGVVVAVALLLLFGFNSGPCILTFPSAGVAIVAVGTLWWLFTAWASPPKDWLAKSRTASGRFWLAALLVTAAFIGGVTLSFAGLSEHWVLSNVLALALASASFYALPAVFQPSHRAGSFQTGMVLTLASLAAGIPLLVRPPPLTGGPLDVLHVLPAAAYMMTLVVVVLVELGRRWLDDTFLLPVMTDSARMFSDSPVNIPNQNRIRKRGMELLEMLHGVDPEGCAYGRDQKDRRDYDRVVVLSHSLGTVVAYRLLAHYWGTVYNRLPVANAATAARAVDDAAEALDRADGEPNELLIRWRKAVRAYWTAVNPVRPKEPAKSDRPWLISDFITIGAPLTYAHLLLDSSDAAFLKQLRLYKRHPTSPPQPREIDSTGMPFGKIFDEKGWPHHAALFAATCWTNLFFPPEHVVQGDIIGGPIGADPPRGLGRGVLDVDLGADNSVEGFTHTEYWKWPSPPVRSPQDLPAPMHIAALRDALRLFIDAYTHDDPGGPNAEALDRRLLTPNESYLRDWPPAAGDPPAPLLRTPRVGA